MSDLVEVTALVAIIIAFLAFIQTMYIISMMCFDRWLYSQRWMTMETRRLQQQRTAEMQQQVKEQFHQNELFERGARNQLAQILVDFAKELKKGTTSKKK